MLSFIAVYGNTASTHPQQSLNQLVFNNKHFSESHQEEIYALNKGQSPPTMVLTCSDSRVSTEILTEAQLGDLFVHRNVANLFNENDDSVKSALFYSTNVLKVKKIAVIGHTECGGVKHALELNAGEHNGEKDVIMGPLNRYVASVQNLIVNKYDYSVNNARVNILSERNVRSNVMRIKNSPMVAKGIIVEGYMYSLANGTLIRVV